MTPTWQQWISSSPSQNVGKPYAPDMIASGYVEFLEKEQVFRIRIGAQFNENYTYDIAADRLRSGRSYLDFLLQIQSKDWCTPQHMLDFMNCVACWVHREHDVFPQAFFDVCGGANEDLDKPAW